jgi:hypothetical protein
MGCPQGLEQHAFMKSWPPIKSITILQSTIPIYVASHLITPCSCILFIQGETKRNARLAMSSWYLEDSQHYNTIKYASSISVGKKNIIKEKKRKMNRSDLLERQSVGARRLLD